LSKQNEVEVREDELAHVQLSRDFFLTTKLHDQVLITGLTLSDGDIEAKLGNGY
jgi:hypothetical protein